MEGATFSFSLPRYTSPPSAVSSVSRWFSPYGAYEARPRRSLAETPAVRPRFVVLEEGGALERLLRSYAGNVEVARVADRAEAIRRAIRMARAGDVVLVAGKGHETTQDFGNTIVPFDDRQIVAQELGSL